MNMPLEISFGQSSSNQLNQAVRLAAGLPGYQLVGQGRQACHLVKLDISLDDPVIWPKLLRLVRLIGNWRSTSIKVGEQPMAYQQLEHTVSRIRGCYRQKERHGEGDHYCSGQEAAGEEGKYFGCRLCRSVSRRLSFWPFGHEHSSWLEFGKLAPGLNSFQVDKKAILHVLQEEATHHGWIYCPAFSEKRLRADVEDLPNVLAVGKDSPFEVRFSEINPGKPLGIRPKAKVEDDFELTLTGADEATPGRQVPTVRFADIAGQDAALAAIHNVIKLPLTHGEFFSALGVKPQAGILLYGPPGNGKTLLAKAAASECQAHLETINGPEILSKWVGQSEQNLREVFQKARQWAPSVLLIDELDSIAPRRNLMDQHHQIQLISQLLVLMDGLEARGQVAIIATTNRIEALDPAVCRPGRLDYHIEVPLPDRKGRAAILRVHLKTTKTTPRLALAKLAQETAGYSGAELAALCREAGLQAIQRGIVLGLAPAQLVLTLEDLEQARQAWRGKRAFFARNGALQPSGLEGS